MDFDFIIAVVLKYWFMDYFSWREDDDAYIEFVDFSKSVVTNN